MNLQPALLQMNLYCTVLTAKTTLIPSVLHTILLVMLLRTVCVRPTGASRVSPPPPPRVELKFALSEHHGAPAETDARGGFFLISSSLRRPLMDIIFSNTTAPTNYLTR